MTTYEGYGSDKQWKVVQEPHDCYLGFTDDDGTEIVLATGIDPETAGHVAELHNAWLDRN